MTKAPGMNGKKAAPPQPTVRQYLAITVLRALEEMTVDVREGAGGAMRSLAAFIAWRYRDDDSMSPEEALEALERTRLISFSQVDHAYHVREAWLSISGRLQGLPVPGARVLTPERIKRLYAWQRAGCQSFTDTQADTDPPEGWEPPSKSEVHKEAKKSLPPPPPPLEEPEIDLFPVVSDLSAASRLLRAARRPFDMKSFRLILLAHSKGNEAEADKLQQALVKKGCYQSDGRGIISLVQRVVASFTHGRALVWSSDEELRKILEIPPEVRPEPPPPRITPPPPKPEVVALAEPLVPDELNKRFRTVSGILAKNVLVLEENLPGSCVPEDIFLYVAKPIAGGTPAQAHKLLGEYLALGFLVQSQQDGTLVLSRDGHTWAEAQEMRPNVNIDLLRRLFPKVFSVEVQEPTSPVEAVVSAPAEEIKEPEAEAAAPVSEPVASSVVDAEEPVRIEAPTPGPEEPTRVETVEVAAKTDGRKRTDPRDPAKGHTYCRIIYIHLEVEKMLGGPIPSTLSNELLDTIVRSPQPNRTNMKTGGLLHDVSSFRNARNRTEILWRVTDAGRQFLLEHPLQAPPLSDKEIRERIETWKAKNTPAAPAPNASEPPPHVEAPVSEPVAPSVVEAEEPVRSEAPDSEELRVLFTVPNLTMEGWDHLAEVAGSEGFSDRVVDEYRKLEAEESSPELVAEAVIVTPVAETTPEVTRATVPISETLLEEAPEAAPSPTDTIEVCLGANGIQSPREEGTWANMDFSNLSLVFFVQEPDPVPKQEEPKLVLAVSGLSNPKDWDDLATLLKDPDFLEEVARKFGERKHAREVGVPAPSIQEPTPALTPRQKEEIRLRLAFVSAEAEAIRCLLIVNGDTNPRTQAILEYVRAEAEALQRLVSLI